MKGWQPIETAPRDQPILVWYDHDADPYGDPQQPGKITAYAAHAEGGDFLSGKGISIAHWSDGWWEHEGWDALQPEYWLPGVWFAWLDGDCMDQVVNPIFWMPLPEPPHAGEGG